jgi:serine/threonine-protein kinase
VTASAHPWGSRCAPAFEVIAYSSLSLQVPAGRYGYEGRSHSLWYCDAREAGGYQWFETAFALPALVRAATRQEPFALNPSEEAAEAFAPGLSAKAVVAWPLMPVSAAELREFIDRWAGWLADAAEGRLMRPNVQRSVQVNWRLS